MWIINFYTMLTSCIFLTMNTLLGKIILINRLSNFFVGYRESVSPLSIDIEIYLHFYCAQVDQLPKEEKMC